MKLQEENITFIKEAFNKMKSIEDFVALLNYAKIIVYGEKAIPFELKHITYHSNPKTNKKRYVQFTVKKKSGEERIIHSPAKGLKAIQKCLNLIFQTIYNVNAAATGFVTGRSIVDNAKNHTGSLYVYNIDLKDFFPSVEAGRIWGRLQHPPFNLNEKTRRKELANIITWLCCHEMEVERLGENNEWQKVKRSVLPQGAPTSPTLTNIVCQQFDFYLSAVAKRFGLKYSRYADDITFSSMHNVFKKDGDFLKELHRIITVQHFHIKESKTRLQKQGYRQEVTGLLVNEKVNVQKRYVKELRMWLYFWERYGYAKANAYFLPKYKAEKGHVKKGQPNMVNVIAGKLEYLKMVKGEENEMYLKLKSRFDKRNIQSKKANSESEITTEFDTSQVRITLEVYQSPEMNEKLNNSINIPNDTNLPSTIIVTNSIDEIEGEKIKLNNLYPIMHTPSKTVELLKYFTANDKDLKYSTHSWEEGKYNSYEEYMDKIRQEWKEINEELKRQSSRLHGKISNFLFHDRLGQKNEKGYHNSWGEKRLKFGWSSPELKIHMNELGNSPFSCKIPDDIKELDKKHGLFYFKDYAEVFKNEIEFREDSKNLKKIILELKKSELANDFNIVGFDNLVGFSFFTDVHYVKEVIKIIFGEMFKKRPEFPNIITERISDFDMGFHLIRITQKNSYVTREFSDKKISNPSGDLIKIINSMRNLGDYSIISKFGDGKNYRINYLTSSKMPFIENLSNGQKVEGFTHEFKFYL